VRRIGVEPGDERDTTGVVLETRVVETCFPPVV
jgi:hypothetical protein